MRISISLIKLKITNMLVGNVSVELEKPMETEKYQIYLLNDDSEVVDLIDSFEKPNEVFNFVIKNNATIVEFIDEVKED